MEMMRPVQLHEVSISVENIWLLIFMLSMGNLPAVPRFFSVSSLIFILLLIPFLLNSRKNTELSISGFGVISFLLICVLSVFWIIDPTTEIYDWFRQLVPYIFLLLLFVFPQKSYLDAQYVVKCFHYSALYFVLVNLFYFIIEAGFDFIAVSRLTYLNFNFVIPIAFIACMFAIFESPFKSLLAKCLYISLMLFVIIGSGYRSQILLILFTTFVAVLLRRDFRRLLLFFVFLAILPIIVNLLDLSILNDLVSRFETISNESRDNSRLYEIEYALDAFAKSPIFGNGLGHSIPVSVIFFDDLNIFYELQTDRVRYIHNVWAYLLMDLGLFGLLTFLGIFIRPIIFGLSCHSGLQQGNPVKTTAFSLAWVIVMLLIYSTVEAVYRQIQFNILAAAFLAAIYGVMAYSKKSVRC